MYKILRADRDTYITDRVINGSRVVSSSVGFAGSLDLFKLYGATMSGSVPNIELSRILIHFDLSTLSSSVSSGVIDTSSNSFFCKLQLKDVYGGQPTPDNFTVTVNPLSATFREGRGKDVVWYADRDIANFLTSSPGTLWYMSGCGLPGDPTTPCDFITGAYATTQTFVSGEEDLNVDVTTAVKAMLTGEIPDRGFRIALTDVEESDDYTYFVKRFASRHAYNEDKRPRLVYGYDDSVRDDADFLTFDTINTLFMYNYYHGAPSNVVSASTVITGSECMTLRFETPVSGGLYSISFSASQHRSVTGMYSASFTLPLTASSVIQSLTHSGSVTFTPIWQSNSGSYAYVTGSATKFWKGQRSTAQLSATRYIVSVLGLSALHRTDESRVVRVNVFDHTSPQIMVVKIPVNSPQGLRASVSDAFYSVRDVQTNEIIIPFDRTFGSTRLSNDTQGLYFTLDMSSLTPERSYVIDVMILAGGNEQRYLNASSVFKVSDLQ